MQVFCFCYCWCFGGVVGCYLLGFMYFSLWPQHYISDCPKPYYVAQVILKLLAIFPPLVLHTNQHCKPLERK